MLQLMNENPQQSAQERDSIAWIDTASIVLHGNIFVFDRFQPQGNVVPFLADDETGLECSLNHFHVSCPNEREAVGTAIIIFANVLELWRHTLDAGKRRIRQIVSIAPIEDGPGRFELSYRFHVIRKDQSWLAADLDQYEEIIMVCE
jgi:hypothetical protein